MNYYERHLGDYARDTAHLSLVEHGVYTLLLDRIYATEAGIPVDQVHRIARARTADERAAVDSVVAEFFVVRDGLLVNGRALLEIEKAKVRIETARTNGRTGGRPKASPPGTHREPAGFSTGNPEGNPDLTQSKAHQTPDTRHQTPPQEQKHEPPDGGLSPASPDGSPPTPDDGAPEHHDAGPSAPRQSVPLCPQAEIIAAYHEILPVCPPVRAWTEQDAKMLRVRWREDPARWSLGWWREFFAYVSKCPFLVGQKTDFQASLGWLVRPTNFAKVLNGNYEARS